MHCITFYLQLATLILLRNYIEPVFAIKEKTDRVFTPEELSEYIGKDKKGPVYLAVLGEVYDVTAGREFYQEGEGYSFFAGRDATISFFTGNYDVEHLNDKKVLDFEATEILSMDGWRLFYEEHEEYQFLGVLVGDYYDSEGKETPYLVKIRETVKVAQAEALEKKRIRDEALKKRRLERLAREAGEEAEKTNAEL